MKGVESSLMVWILFSIIILLLIILLIFSRLSIHVHILLKEHDQKVVVRIKLYRIRIFEMRKKFITNRKNLWDVLDDLYDSKSINWQDFLVDFKYLYWLFTHLLGKTRIDQLSWQTKIGGQEAINGGLYAGMMWMIKGFLIGMLSKQSLDMCKPQTSVTPYFQKQYFQSEFNCMLSIRTGQAIHTFIKTITRGLSIGKAYI